jgi:hypothetical protein
MIAAYAATKAARAHNHIADIVGRCRGRVADGVGAVRAT